MNTIIKYITTAIIGLGIPSLCGASVTFEGSGASHIVEVTPAATSGLNTVYVIENTAGLSMVYTAQSASSAVQWQRFSNLGGAYAEDVTPERSGARLTLPCEASDMGYIITEGSSRTCIWVVNYSRHQFAPMSIAPRPEDSDCGRMAFTFEGAAAEIPFYSITGRHMTLARDIEVRYQTLSFNEDAFVYSPADATETVEYISSVLSIPAPLCNTTVTVTGDRFLRAWNREISISSPAVEVTAVEAQTRATQTPRDADNEQRDENNGLGGSAPCEVTFEAAVSDAAIFTEWQISRQPDFTTIDNSYNETEFTYTFTDNGTTYVRFTANNADGTCPYEGTVYEVFIGESKLEIPNAFSPGATPGVNDEWKVSYRSLVSYQCHIFNSWGKQLFSSTNPAEGWDGKVGSKVVPAGVYYYVIEAVGADGVRYKKAGDINVVGYSERNNGTSAGTDE
ncbi:MAG: gliding motility-associated C-terminal domain-containing protein [Muribaculaceae bacterium]|nr:gliding motility-associated C-terminal domain-containing protein [Muribaculaceae bacterium]